MKIKLIAAMVFVMILTMAGTALAGPHGGGPRQRSGGSHFGNAPRPGRGAPHAGMPRNNRPPHQGIADHRFNRPRPGTGDQHFGRGPRPGDGRPAHAERPDNSVVYTETDDYSESYSDNGYIGNNTVSAVFTILNSIFNVAQSVRSSSYVAQEDENITYITPNSENTNYAMQQAEAGEANGN